MVSARTWRFSLSTRIALGVLAFFMFGFAAVLFGLPFSVGGDRSGDWVVIATGVVITWFGLFAVFALIAALKTRVMLNGPTFEATIVSGHDVFLIPRFRTVRLSVSDIRAVERRREIFRTLGFYSMRDALSIVTTEGERIGLCSDTIGTASTLPIDDVAHAIATAAETTVTDDGTVRTGGSGLYGAASSSWVEHPLDHARASKMQRVAVLTMQVCTVLLLLTLLLRTFL
jgi:hypothetical protein